MSGDRFVAFEAFEICIDFDSGFEITTFGEFDFQRFQFGEVIRQKFGSLGRALRCKGRACLVVLLPHFRITGEGFLTGFSVRVDMIDLATDRQQIL